VLSRIKGQTQTVLNTLSEAEVRTRQMTRALKGVESLPDERAQELLPGGMPDDEEMA
jgi:DNA recombination protein RmuC